MVTATDECLLQLWPAPSLGLPHGVMAVDWVDGYGRSRRKPLDPASGWADLVSNFWIRLAGVATVV